MSATIWRLVCAALLSAVLVAVATAGMYVTTAPRLISLLLEPFSLLLMPGLVVAVMLAGPHDFSPGSVVFIAVVFYCGFFFWALPRISKALQFELPGSR